MPSVIFAVDEYNRPKILKIDSHDHIPEDDINAIESDILIEGEDYSLGVYKGSLIWIDDTNYYSEDEVGGYWALANDFELLGDFSDE